ncbi:ribonuclease H-like domain-containing protein [Tanacetum coccineum]
MACSVPHTYDEIKTMVEKQIEEDKACQLAIMNLVVEYENACGAKDDLRKAYEECNHIPQEARALINTFLKEGSNKDYEMHNSLFETAEKIEKQMNAKLVWLREKYNYRSQTHIDEEALREILEEEEARDEKEREKKIKQKQAADKEYYLEFRMRHYELFACATGGIVTGCLGDIKNFLKNGKLEQVVAIVKSCSSNVIGDLTVTMKDLSGTIPGTIHHKVIGDRDYGKYITVFRKDTVPGSGSGSDSG